MKTELIISDFDGTLVDTQEANFQAYKKVLSHFNIFLTEDMYHRLFGMRLKEFMQYIGINDANMIESPNIPQLLQFDPYQQSIVRIHCINET